MYPRPLVRVVAAVFGQAAVARGADGNLPRGLVPDVAIHVGVHHVLSGSVKGRKSAAELLPVLRRIHFKKRIVGAVVERPAQSQLTSFAGDEFSDHGSVTGHGHIHHHIWLALHVNHFAAVLRRLPSFGSQILAIRIESLDVNVFDGRADIGEAPGDALVVSHDHVRQAGQSDAGSVEVAAAQMSLIPKVGHLVSQVHIVREQGLARNRVRPGNHPVV